MKSKIIIAIFTIIWVSNLYSQQQDYPLVSIPQTTDRGIPSGWILSGSNPQDYTVGSDLEESYSGFSSAYIKSVSSKPVGFLTLMQTFKANNYRSQRVKLTAYIKTAFVSGWASLWMRVSDASGKPLSFDDMRERPMIGSMQWTPVHIVLDIPSMSNEISFGVLLQGKGQVWIDNIKITMVGQDVPVTDILKDKTELYSPKNLDFEE
jgi:hypothetical protein